MCGFQPHGYHSCNFKWSSATSKEIALYWGGLSGQFSWSQYCIQLPYIVLDVNHSVKFQNCNIWCSCCMELFEHLRWHSAKLAAAWIQPWHSRPALSAHLSLPVSWAGVAVNWFWVNFDTVSEYQTHFTIMHQQQYTLEPNQFQLFQPPSRNWCFWWGVFRQLWHGDRVVFCRLLSQFHM